MDHCDARDARIDILKTAIKCNTFGFCAFQAACGLKKKKKKWVGVQQDSWWKMPAGQPRERPAEVETAAQPSWQGTALPTEEGLHLAIDKASPTRQVSTRTLASAHNQMRRPETEVMFIFITLLQRLYLPSTCKSSRLCVSCNMLEDFPELQILEPVCRPVWKKHLHQHNRDWRIASTCANLSFIQPKVFLKKLLQRKWLLVFICAPLIPARIQWPGDQW